jgi:hypothetical protein
MIIQVVTMVVILTGVGLLLMVAEHRLVGRHPHLDKLEWTSLWLLRLAGLWLIGWLLWPAVASTQEIAGFDEMARERLNAQADRLGNIERRMERFEMFREESIEQRAIVVGIKADLDAQSAWLRGIAGSMLAYIGVQLLNLFRRERIRDDV